MRSLLRALAAVFLLLAGTAQAQEEYRLDLGERLKDAVIGSDGRLWLFTTANYNPTSDVVVGNDGRFWFGTANGVSAVDLDNHQTNLAIGRTVTSVAAAPYGGVWFARTNANIGYVDNAGGTTERLAPTATPYDLAVAADGTVWLTQLFAANVIYHIQALGGVTPLQLPVRCYGGRIAAAPDGTVWITSPESSSAVRIGAFGDVLELIKLPKDIIWTERPLLTADGSLWLGQRNGIVRVANGVAMRYGLATPTYCIDSFYLYVPRAQEPDGALWISRELVASITPDPAHNCATEPSTAEAQTVVMRVSPETLVADPQVRRRATR